MQNYKQKIKNIKFPKISRFITECRYRNKAIIAGSLLSVGLLIGIGIVGWDLYKNIQQKKNIQVQRQKLISEINFWKGVSEKYKGYRDAYFKLAVLEYRLRNNDKSQFYLQRALTLDPNFTRGRVLENVLKTDDY